MDCFAPLAMTFFVTVGGVTKQPVVSSHSFDEPKNCDAIFLTALRF